MPPKRANGGGDGKSALELAREEAMRAVEQRAAQRTTAIKDSPPQPQPQAKKRPSSSNPAPAAPAPAPAARRGSSGGGGGGGGNLSPAAAAREEARRALEERMAQRAGGVGESPSPPPTKKRASSSGAVSAAAPPAASTARRRSGAPAPPKPAPMEESSEEEEDVDDRMEVEEEEEEERPPRGRAAGGAGGKRASPSQGGKGAAPPKRARRQQQQEAEEEEDERLYPQRRGSNGGRRHTITTSATMAAEEEEDYVDPRFHNPRTTTAAPPAPAPAPAPWQPSSTGGGRLSWGDPTSYLPSFWGRTYGGHSSSGSSGRNASPAVGGGGGFTWPPPHSQQPQPPRPSLSPSKRVAFREEVETFAEQDEDARGRRSSLGGAGASSTGGGVRRRSASGAASSSLSLPPSSASASPVRSILKKPRPSLDPAPPAPEVGSERISFLGSLGGQVVAKLAFPILGFTVAAAWLCALAALVLGLHGLVWREGCPQGQVREGWFGLWGECVVSTRALRQLVRALEHATVQRVCADMPWKPWGSAYGRPGALEEGSALIPAFAVEGLWAEPLRIVPPYPWEDLKERGVDPAWQAFFTPEPEQAQLRGRAQLLRALWREWALPCRCKLLLAERWGWLAGLAAGLLAVGWVALAARRQRRAKRDAERVKRVVLDLLAAEGEIAPEHARDELLQHLNREYRHLSLSRGALKGLWPRVARLVERDSRVAKAPRERHGRAIPHWIWMGRRASGALGALGGGPLHRHHHQPLKPIHEEGEGARAVVI